jgi:hypothetical protein
MATNKQVFKEIGKDAYNGLKGIASFTTGVAEGFFAIPTSSRKYCKCWPANVVLGTGTCLVSSLASSLYLLVALNHNMKLDPKYFSVTLGTVLTTNAISGLYEWYRHNKNKIEEAEKKTGAGLEARVETTVENQPESPAKIIDPWSVEIPRLKDENKIVVGGRN